MLSRLVASFRNFRPFDLFIVAAANVIVGLYVWTPFIRDMESKRAIEKNAQETPKLGAESAETTANSESKSK